MVHGPLMWLLQKTSHKCMASAWRVGTVCHGLSQTTAASAAGLFFDAADWDAQQHELAESKPKVLFAPVPKMHFQPKKIEDFEDFPHYNCPMYKTSERKVCQCLFQLPSCSCSCLWIFVTAQIPSLDTLINISAAHLC